MSAGRIVPVQFIPNHIAVNEAQAFEMLGLNDGRSLVAKKRAFYLFRMKYGIETLPGGVFPAKKLEAALST